MPDNAGGLLMGVTKTDTPQLMKKLTKILLTLGFLSAFCATTAVAQIPPPVYTVQIDENGSLLINNQLAGQGVLGIEPISGMQGLRYDASGLGVPWQPGDVALVEPGSTSQAYSDVIRFSASPLGLASAVWFFSLRDDNDPVADLADVPVLPTLLDNNVIIDEVGPEGSNGAIYRPLTTDMPGCVTLTQYAGAIEYHFLSDVVPEPSSIALFGVAAGLLAIFRRRQ
jgi:hypothetical protein